MKISVQFKNPEILFQDRTEKKKKNRNSKNTNLQFEEIEWEINFQHPLAAMELKKEQEKQL